MSCVELIPAISQGRHRIPSPTAPDRRTVSLLAASSAIVSLRQLLIRDRRKHADKPAPRGSAVAGAQVGRLESHSDVPTASEGKDDGGEG